MISEDVDVLFGYPGAIMPVYDELYKFQNDINHILVRHEQGATHAAQGYARSSGKVGVAIATSGPGATNLVTGIADAQIDSTPMVCITDKLHPIYSVLMRFKKLILLVYQHLLQNGTTRLQKHLR